MSKDYQKFLVVGATGLSGQQIVKQLIQAKKEVTICIRNEDKARKLFKGIYDDIKTKVVHELGYHNPSQDLEKAIAWCDVLIDASSSMIFTDAIPQICDYEKTKELLNIIKKQGNQLKKYVLITAVGMTRPYGFPSIFLNQLLSYVMGWKALAENKLRQSGIDYFIIRPARLTNEENTNSTSVQLLQGDRVTGKISRANVAKAILDVLSSPDLNKSKLTAEVFEVAKKDKYFEVPTSLKSDGEKDFVTADHFKSTKRVTLLLYFILFLIVIYLVSKFKA